MGCGGSKEESNPNEIKSQMKETKVAEFDDFFKTASEFLEGLEDLRARFQDTREEMNELGRTDELVTPSLIEAVKVFLWSVSAHKDGNIKAAGLSFETDPPAFTVDCGHMDYKTYDFSAAFKELVGGLVGAPQKIADLTGQVKEITEKANSLKSGLKEKVDNSGLDPMGKMKATANAGVNFTTVFKGLAKAPEVLKQASEAVTDVKALLPKIKDLVLDADTVGKEAAGKGHKKMDEIFEHYQKAPKKTPEQVKAEHKGKKPKNKKKAKKHAAGEHKAGEHKAEGHKAEGHKDEGHKAEGHKDEGHKAEGHAHAGGEHKAEGHAHAEHA